MTPFIQMLHDAILAQAKLEQKKQHRQCHFCKSTLGDIHANGKVGCAMCYDVFADELNPLIELVQNPMKVSDLHHIGKTPKSIHDEASALSPILESLEEQVVLMKLLSDTDGFINVKIGDEQPEKGLSRTSSVSMGYGQGAVGVLGPTRMDYAGSMAAVHAVARYIGRFISEAK